MIDSRTELEKLLERRDLAAYRAVSKIKLVLDFWEAEDFENAEKLLRSALAEFDEADRNVNQFRKKLPTSQTQEKPADGNRNSAA